MLAIVATDHFLLLDDDHGKTWFIKLYLIANMGLLDDHGVNMLINFQKRIANIRVENENY